MVELNQNSTSQDGAHSTVQTRFANFCKNDLRLENGDLLAQATKLLEETKNLLLANISAVETGPAEEAERYLFAFVLYSVRRLSENGKGLTLCQILRASRLNIVDFFKEFQQYLIKVGSILSIQYGEDWEKRLEAKESQTNFILLMLLNKLYKRAFQKFFSTVDVVHNKTSTTSGDVSKFYRFGWLLFLALREHVFCRVRDLITCTHGLVSILAILLIHIPDCFRSFSFNDSQFIVMRNEKADLFASLCKMYDTSEEELKKTYEKANNLITDMLNKQSCLASKCKPIDLENVVTDGLIYFGDLMEDSSLSSSITLLEKDYEVALYNKGELDERIYINMDDTLLESGSLSGGAIHLSGNGVKRKLDSVSSPTKTIRSPLSPIQCPGNCTDADGMSKMTATPVSTAMSTAKWLWTVIAPLPSKPSVELEKFLSSCDRDLTSDVIRRVQIILEAIFPSGGPGLCGSFMDNIWAEERRLEAMKLYYRVLQAMCTAESQVLPANNLTSLLSNERFHRCMLACSAELVIATHKTVTVLFPSALERIGITAFDLSKVIECFIRHEESLPRELKRHLNSQEERFLESMVWEKGSSLYNCLTVARPALSAEISRLGLLAEPMPSLDAIALRMDMQSLLKKEKNGENGDIRSPKRLCTEYRSILVERNSFASPGKDRLLALNNLKLKFPPPALQSAFASPTRPSPGGGGETCAETTLNMFSGKIIKLAAVRINGMVERLQLSQQIRESVYCLFQKVLGQRMTLFFNRHIDQLILCCFYGVAKISKLNLTFKEIVNNYKKQPHCKTQVFRCVYLDWTETQRHGKSGPDHVDIVIFYNEIFVPAVKPLLVEIANISNSESEARNDNEGPCPTSPKPSTFPTIPDMSPRKVSSKHNVYVSPLRSSKMDALISNSSKSYYACVGESTHAYQSPSKDLTAINKQLNGSRKLRGTLNFDDVDVGLVTDSIVGNSLSPPNGKKRKSSSQTPLKSEPSEPSES